MGTILKDNFQEFIPITLAGNSAAIKSIKNTNFISIYIYMALPLSTRLKTTAIHLCPTKSRSPSIGIVKKFDAISNRLRILVHDVKFINTDGDQSFNRPHEECFEAVDQIS